MEQKQLVTTARLTGVWYLLLAISGIVGFMVFHPRIFVTDDPQKTLLNLTEQVSIARIRLLCELLIIFSQTLAAVWFYKLFRDIDKWAATILGIWGTVNSIVIMVSAIAMSSAMDIAASVSLPNAEKAGLIQLLVSTTNNAWSIGGLFFGLWLMPMGYIVITSKRMPVWLGRILLIGGIGYIMQTVITCAGIDSSYSGILTLPATAGELWMIGYLLIFGIRPKLNNAEY